MPDHDMYINYMDDNTCEVGCHYHDFLRTGVEEADIDAVWAEHSDEPADDDDWRW